MLWHALGTTKLMLPRKSFSSVEKVGSTRTTRTFRSVCYALVSAMACFRSVKELGASGARVLTRRQEWERASEGASKRFF